MAWVWILFVAMLLLDALKLRARANALRTLPKAGLELAEGDLHRVVARRGAPLPEDVEARAQAYARAESLDVLDVVPAGLATFRCLALLQTLDPARFRQQPLAPGGTSGHALLISADVAGRAGVEGGEKDFVGLFRLAKRLKRYAARSTDIVVAPALGAVPEPPDARWAILESTLPIHPVVVLAIQAAFIGGLLTGLAWTRVRPWGVAAMVMYHLHPALALAGTPLRPPDLGRSAALRLPLELWGWLQTVAGRHAYKPTPDPLDSRRAEYAELLPRDPAIDFDPRRETCPMCEGDDLVLRLRTTDLAGHKPGEFRLDRCRGCGHIFQNPRLTVEGLNFYYKDVYDGLGQERMEFMFSIPGTSYQGRADMVAAHSAPDRWLDVGAGYGHFCCVAQALLPHTTFDGLDMGESIEEAQRRLWIDRAYRGLFPDLADDFAGEYDVVSMHHYLEHTLEPGREIEAAHRALAVDGLLLIEVPDPECFFGTLLGRYWIPWYQPQHLHFLAVGALERLLGAQGFDVVARQRGPAHLAMDFFSAAYLMFRRFAPRSAPWLPVPSAATQVFRAAVWIFALPWLAAAGIVDALISPITRSVGPSNAYRVLARKRPV